MAKMTVVCTGWRALRKGSLLGFAQVRIDELALSIIDVPVNASHGKVWASPPSKPGIKDGAVVIGDNGRPQYFPVFKFDRDEVRQAFSDAVVRAVRERFPDALALAEAAP